MAQELHSTEDRRPIASHKAQIHREPARPQLQNDDDYSSSESDADVEISGPGKEAQPLIAHGDSTDHAQPQAVSARSTSTTSSEAMGRKRRAPLKWTELIWVTCTLALISVLGFTSQLCIMLPYYHKTPSFSPTALSAVLAPFNLGLFFIFYNYYLCVTTDPGSVPAGWEPDWSCLDPTISTRPSEGDPALELKETILRPRYCKTCRAYKPPRSHHCKTCHRCVLRMDHHCPWLANCVGHYNYAHFIRFLFWVDVTCSYHLVMISCRVLDKFNSYGYWREPSTRELIWLVVNYALCIPVILLVGVFSIYHFYCTAINQTTIESWEKDRTATLIRRGRIRKVKYPYNLGLWRNVRSVLGDNPITWCLPRGGTNRLGDGLKFAVAPTLDEGAQYRWPPKDPTRSTTTAGVSQHGWRADGHEAPPLFPSSSSSSSAVLPPGATSSSPFTYGNEGFNPNLRPTNSSHLHYEEEDDEEGMSSISSGSDDDVDILHHSNGEYYPRDQEVFEEGQDEEEDEAYSRATGIHVRRGSEGYEVRPRAAWVI